MGWFTRLFGNTTTSTDHKNVQGAEQAAVTLKQHGVEEELANRFIAFLTESPDHEVFHMNPRYLAERLTLDERRTLKILLLAMYEGLVDLHWDVRCPKCGNIGHMGHSLGQLHHEDDCAMCQFHFAPHLDHEVRVTFSPHERFRRLPDTANDTAFRQAINERLGFSSGLTLMLIPEFERLFPQQRILPDESLKVTRVALIFTDLAGSTALYARRGDPRAYHLVRLHFDALMEVADRMTGTVVKTIGDAILAAFQSPRESFLAALQMQEAIDTLNEQRQLSGEERLILKVGLHCGPCLSVTLNERPDYFGTTVNTAARVQGLSHGNDIVFTDIIRTDPEVASFLQGQSIESQRVMLKGIDGETLVHYLKTAS
ncbi:MAG: adenylate/guanylate cyclase domain-containing protein [Chloroflexaceae bacterium]|nr:adenylate/guanylate cyclase domain-containing protein [Chloroflexaceae bacterium]